MSTIQEKFFPNREGRLETLFQKGMRHLLMGEYDGATLKRGWLLMKQYLESQQFNNLFFNKEPPIDNFGGHQGVTVCHYILEGWKQPIGRREKISIRLSGKVGIIEFPARAQLVPMVYGTNDHLDHQEPESDLPDLVDKSGQEFIGEFVGPTINDYHLPNNGFFTSTEGILVPFMDTNPIGQRRGALAIDKEGGFSILDEPAKLRARKDNFGQYDLVAGTSFYFSSQDDVRSPELHTMRDDKKSLVTYVIEFKDAEGHERLAHLSIDYLVPRRKVKELLDQHAKSRQWQAYIAAEIELVGGGCYLTDKRSSRSHPQYAFVCTLQNASPWSLLLSRRDHYFITQPTNVTG